MRPGMAAFLVVVFLVSAWISARAPTTTVQMIALGLVLAVVYVVVIEVAR